MQGFAAYGADGVQGVLEMLQTELARYMGMCGRVRLADLDRTSSGCTRVADNEMRPGMSRRRAIASLVAAPALGRALLAQADPGRFPSIGDCRDLTR